MARSLFLSLLFCACQSKTISPPSGTDDTQMQTSDRGAGNEAPPPVDMAPTEMLPAEDPVISPVDPDPADPTCTAGYMKSGSTCMDIDECATDNGGCGPKAGFVCTNTPGAFACTCNTHCDWTIPATMLQTAPKYYSFFGANVDSDHDGTGDGVAVKPGDHICFESGTRTGISFFDVNGTPENPVVISNMCNGKVTIDPTGAWGNVVSTSRSSNFRITGGVSTAEEHGIEVVGGNFGINLFELSTKFEVDHIYLHDSESSAIVAKTDPTCDASTHRGNFLLENVSIHHNKVQNTINEGFYIGNSHHDLGVDKTCSGNPVHIEEHDVHGVRVYDNVLDHTGNESIQIGASKDCIVHHNTMTDAGYLNADASQSNGFQAGSGTQVTFYANEIVQNGKGCGIFDLGGGGTYYDNVVIGGAACGLSLQDVQSDWAPQGFAVYNNTFIGWKSVGVIMYTENPEPSVFFNNILVPAATSSFEYIHLNNSTPGAIKWTASNNLQTTDLGSVKFVSAQDLRLKVGSPAIDQGKPSAATVDFDGNARPQGPAFDIGAFEFTP